MTRHGPVLWALMAKENVLQPFKLHFVIAAFVTFSLMSELGQARSCWQKIHGLHAILLPLPCPSASLHLRRATHPQIFASQRKEIKRVLDPTSLAFITCCAAFGYGRGVGEFDKVPQPRSNLPFLDRSRVAFPFLSSPFPSLTPKALKAGRMSAVETIIVDYVNFGKFFWTGNLDSFSLCGCWKIIDTLWDYWDFAEPVKIHGFVSFPSLLLSLPSESVFLIYS